MQALLVMAFSVIVALGWTHLVWAATSDESTGMGMESNQASLELVPAHFREKIHQARNHLSALLHHRAQAAALPSDAYQLGSSSGVGSVLGIGTADLAAPLDSKRWEVLLDGVWSYYPVIDGRMEASTPSRQRVPQEFDGPETAWYALRFDVPSWMEGKRFYLSFEGVTLYAEVYVNGVSVGAHAGRFTPFEIDITDAAKVGEENILHVLNGSAAVAYDRRLDAFFFQVGGTTEMERLQLTPIERQSSGIWGSVTLVARPHVHVVDQFVVPSVRKETLTAQVTVVNRSDQPATLSLRHRIEGATDPAVFGPSAQGETFRLLPGQEETIELEVEWRDPILWDLERPFLYWFVTEIISGDEVIDEARVRFGFREFWIEGPDFVLNGSKIRLMGESGVWPKWDPRPGEETPRPGRPWSRWDRPGVEALYRAYKEMNMTALRLHYRIGSRVEIEVADELGLLLIPQSGIWTLAEPYQRGGPDFFRNLRREFAEWIRRDRNSPAVVMWDVENEILRWGTPITRPWALELDSWVRDLDPSRMILHSGGGKFGDRAHAYSFHMAENYDPVFAAWGKEPDKPVILGEWWIGRQVHHGGGMLVPYGWNQTRSEMDPHHLGRRDRIEMHRLAGVNTMPFDFDRSLIYPVLPMSTGRVAVDPKALALYRDAFSPLFVGLKERGTSAVVGEMLERTAVVINDTPRDQEVRLSWRFRSGDTLLARGERRLSVQNGSRAEVGLEFVIPQVDEVYLELSVEADEYRMTNVHHFDVLAPSALIPSSPLEPYVVYDPEGSILAWMKRHGVPHRPIFGLSGLMDSPSSSATELQTSSADELPVSAASELLGPVLIFGRDALATLPSAEAQVVHAFVRQGGRVLIMEQAVRLPPGQAWHHPGLRLPTPWLPSGLAFWSADISVPYNVRTLGVPATVKEVLMSRYAAVLRMAHPVAQGLPSQLLAHWRAGDGRVVDDAIQIPGGVATPPPGVIPIVGAVGPDNASLVEVVEGDGLYLVNQLEIVSNLDVDPVATRLFINMLSYLEPEVLEIRPPLGLARGQAQVGIDLYVPKGWSLRSLRLWVDDEAWFHTEEPIPTASIDTLMLADGDRQVIAEAEFETPDGPRTFRSEGVMVVSNWRELRDDLEPPRPGWFGDPIKQLKSEEESEGWRHFQDHAERYFGDATRMAPAPGTPGPEHLVWRMPRLKRAQVIAYAGSGEASRVFQHVTLAVSFNQEEWIPLSFNAQPLREADGIAEILLTADISSHTPFVDSADTPFNWFRLEFMNPESPDTLQLGRVTLWGLR